MSVFLSNPRSPLTQWNEEWLIQTKPLSHWEAEAGLPGTALSRSRPSPLTMPPLLWWKAICLQRRGTISLRCGEYLSSLDSLQACATCNKRGNIAELRTEQMKIVCRERVDVCAHVHVHVYMYACTRGCVCVHMHVSTSTLMHVCTGMCTCMSTRVCAP